MVRLLNSTAEDRGNVMSETCLRHGAPLPISFPLGRPPPRGHTACAVAVVILEWALLYVQLNERSEGGLVVHRHGVNTLAAMNGSLGVDRSGFGIRLQPE